MKYKIPKKKIPLFFQAGRIGERKYWGVSKRVHKKGEIVEYKEGLAKVKKVTKKGVYVQTFKKPNGVIELSKKIEFVPESKIEKGKIYPLYSQIAM